MIRVFCDRCGREVTEERYGAIRGIENVGADASGRFTDDYDAICASCFAAFRTFMQVIHDFDARAKRLRVEQERASARAAKRRRAR